MKAELSSEAYTNQKNNTAYIIYLNLVWSPTEIRYITKIKK